MAANEQQAVRWRTPLIRWLSAAAIMLLSVGPVLLAIGVDDGRAARLMISTGAALSAIVLAKSIGARAPSRGELDEREQADRARAMVIGFGVSAGLIFLVYFWTTLAGFITSVALWQPSLRDVGLLLMSLFWLHMVMPSAVLAWRQPKDEEE